MSNKCNVCGGDYELGGRTIKGVNFCSMSCRRILNGKVSAIQREEYQRMVATVEARIKKELLGGR